MMLSNSQVFHLKDDAYFHPDLGWNTSVVGFSLTLQRFSFKYVCLYFLPTGDGTEWQVWLKINSLIQGCLFWFPLWASWFHRQPTLPAVDCSSQLSWWISKETVVLPSFLEPLKLTLPSRQTPRFWWPCSLQFYPTPPQSQQAWKKLSLSYTYCNRNISIFNLEGLTALAIWILGSLSLVFVALLLYVLILVNMKRLARRTGTKLIGTSGDEGRVDFDSIFIFAHPTLFAIFIISYFLAVFA